MSKDDELPFAALLTQLGLVLKLGVLAAGFYYACVSAYRIRMFAIDEYGPIIHEFDPWFNFRATQYLADNGWDRFFTWFDYMSWYPLGRPVGSTIYPGMQITSVWLWRLMNASGIESLAWSLNDVCCYVPCWFGVIASCITGAMTYEATRNAFCAMMTAIIMAVVPAHIMRSVGGGYDNESIAMTTMTGTFYFWMRSIREEEGAWKWGFMTGLWYFYMAATWGGYIFLINMMALHVGILVLAGRYSQNLHRAYSIFYIVGTFFAIRVPVIGWAPLKSFEQLSGLAVFLGLQLIEFCEVKRRAAKKGWTRAAVDMYIKVFLSAGAVLLVISAGLFSIGYFGPLSSRIRGLFVAHTRTGNPLVDSVSEHQPSSSAAYMQYLHNTLYLAPIGFVMCMMKRNNSKLFLAAFFSVAYVFSSKMARLIILMGPSCACLAGIPLGYLASWCLQQCALPFIGLTSKPENESEDNDEAEKDSKDKDKDSKGKKMKAAASSSTKSKKNPGVVQALKLYNHPTMYLPRMALAVMVVPLLASYWWEFREYSIDLAKRMSHPTIVFKAQLNTGETITVNDYVDSYKWLAKHTPEDARVMSWWDYGYQITGIGNRTTLADGNTWNHEHIALLARCLTGEEKESHQLVRHLADYVLVWAGGGGDDLAKSPHLARIGNSVYDDICPGDPTCAHFGRDQYGNPTPFMANSLLYKLHSNGRKGVTVDTNRFQEVYQSRYGKVRIYKVLHVSQESKQWAADPANRECDAPGSWYCVGKYPPAIGKIFAKKGIVARNFAQLEDFNTKKDSRSAKYQEEYMARMAGKKRAKEQREGAAAADNGEKKKKKKKKKKGSKKKKTEL